MTEHDAQKLGRFFIGLTETLCSLANALNRSLLDSVDGVETSLPDDIAVALSEHLDICAAGQGEPDVPSSRRDQRVTMPYATCSRCRSSTHDYCELNVESCRPLWRHGNDITLCVDCQYSLAWWVGGPDHAPSPRPNRKTNDEPKGSPSTQAAPDRPAGMRPGAPTRT
jgi:hypothetical protein